MAQREQSIFTGMVGGMSPQTLVATDTVVVTVPVALPSAGFITISTKDPSARTV
jgi:hypothetical protein